MSGSLPILVTPVPSYRPISLLLILSKLLEKHVQTFLLVHLEAPPPILIQQGGFLKGKSTTGAPLTATEE